MYASIDPIYMAMISWHLGKRYIAWDHTSTVEFKKPGKTALYAQFKLEPRFIEGLRSELEIHDRVDRTFDVQLTDSNGVIHAAFRKNIVVRKRRPA